MVDYIVAVLQSVDEIHHVSVIDIARTGAAGDEIIRPSAKNRKFLCLVVQRKSLTVIFHQHHTFKRGVACYLGIGF